MRSGAPVVAVLLSGFLPTALVGQVEDRVPLALRVAAESLAAGRINAAIRLTERYTWVHPRDPRGFMALGDAYASRLPDGRFRAVENYRKARQLKPHDPEPPYRIAQMGLRLGGADGERLMRDNLEGVLGLDPEYRDAWGEWLLAYRNAGRRDDMIKRLRPFAGRPAVRLRLAQLSIENEEYPAAAAILDSALAMDPSDPAALGLRAQAAFERGDTSGGAAFYRRALRAAATDSNEVLWGQVIGIATPAEIVAWRHGVPSGQRGAWLESFWERRNPDLFSGVNHRVAEHFARLRYARTHYPLLHPFVLFQRSESGRALNLEPSTGEREFYTRCELREGQAPWGGSVSFPSSAAAGSPTELSRVVGGAHSYMSRDELASLEPMARLLRQRGKDPEQARRLNGNDPFAFASALFLPLNMDLRDVDTVAARIGYNLATGLDDRGVMYLRFGAPEEVRYGGDNALDPRCSSTEVERWSYSGLGAARFAKPSAFSEGERNVGEMVFRSMNERQFAVMDRGLTRDATSLPAPLAFGVWMAQFRSEGDPARTDLLVVSTRGELAATLVPPAGGAEQVTRSPDGRLTLEANPGEFVLLADARLADTLGRQSFHASLRSFDSLPRLSDLLLASAWPQDRIDRRAMIDHVRRDLTFPTGTVVRTYAEVYGMSVMAGAVRYHATYRLLETTHPERDIARSEWPGAVVIEFDRHAASEPGDAVAEVLDIDQARLSPGKYLLRLQVRDLATGMDAGHATIAFVVQGKR
jgi:tetratricopeptide (TPR) repeat protein